MAVATGSHNDFIYSGPWGSDAGSHWSTGPGARATVRVRIDAPGGRVTVSGDRGVFMGRSEALITSTRDGVTASPVLVSSYSSDTTHLVRDFWTSPDLAPGEHTLTFTSTTDKDPRATGDALSIGGVLVSNGAVLGQVAPPIPPPPTGSQGKAATLVDDFSAANPKLTYGPGAQNVNQQLVLTGSLEGSTVTSAGLYDLRGSEVSIEAVDLGDTRVWTEFLLRFGTNFVGFSRQGPGLNQVLGTRGGTGTWTGYNATAHRWLRIRHVMVSDTPHGKLLWETSPDRQVWTEQFSRVLEFSVESGELLLFTKNTFATNEQPSPLPRAVFDNLNRAPSPVTPPAGTYTATGTAVDADSAKIDWTVSGTIAGLTGWFVGRDNFDRSNTGPWSTTVNNPALRTFQFDYLVNDGRTYNLTVDAVVNGARANKPVSVAVKMGTAPVTPPPVEPPPPGTSGPWLSGATDVPFGTWRGTPVQAISTWHDNMDAAKSQWTIRPGAQFGSWQGPLITIIGAFNDESGITWGSAATGTVQCSESHRTGCGTTSKAACSGVVGVDRGCRDGYQVGRLSGYSSATMPPHRAIAGTVSASAALTITTRLAFSSGRWNTMVL